MLEKSEFAKLSLCAVISSEVSYIYIFVPSEIVRNGIINLQFMIISPLLLIIKQSTQ